jgi:hypothetical protein
MLRGGGSVRAGTARARDLGRVMRKPSFTTFIARDEFEAVVERLCFGRPASRISKMTSARASRSYRFLPGEIFAVVWQEWQPDGRQHRAMAIVETLSDPTKGVLLPGIFPAVAVHAMVDQGGQAGQGGAVDRFLLLVQSIELAGINPADVPANYWRHASYQIMVRQRPVMPPKTVA